MAVLFALVAGTGRGQGARPVASILVYHRFATAVNDGSTIRISTFRRQLDFLRQHGYHVVPLTSVVAHLRGDAPPPPAPAVVITVDDGHASVFTGMLPLVREYGVPVTAFIYPSAISNASYAMTWDQLAALRDTGLFDIESHTFWHPNFAREKRRLTPEAYRELATTQLCKAGTTLRHRLGVSPTLLSWPFGLYDDELFDIARGCGIVAGVTLERRLTTSGDRLMTLPRFMVLDTDVGARFAAMLPPEPGS
jgi:peptidoglycan/xylan/chitin deacetylase (PgdA/CDA1 family)